MELIATARFKKAMDRASAATAYTNRMTKLVQDLLSSGLEVSHPLLDERETCENATLLVLTANRGLCGGFNGNVQRAGFHRWLELQQTVPNCRLEIVGKRGIAAFKFRGIKADVTFTHFEDRPAFDEVDVIASRYLDEYATGRLDRLDVVYTKFVSIARQQVVRRNAAAAVGDWRARRQLQTGNPMASCRSRRSPRHLRIPAVAGKHFGRSRAGQLQGEAVQVLFGFGRERADCPHGRHEKRHRKRRRFDPPTEQAIQPRPAKPHHVRTDGRDRRRRGDELIRN